MREAGQIYLITETKTPVRIIERACPPQYACVWKVVSLIDGRRFEARGSEIGDRTLTEMEVLAWAARG